MCGRFAQRSDPKRLAKEFKVAEVPKVEARYNIAPTQEILSVRESADGREMTFFKWGFGARVGEGRFDGGAADQRPE